MKSKRLLGFVLMVAVALLAMIPVTVFAEDDIVYSGECGANGDSLTGNDR